MVDAITRDVSSNGLLLSTTYLPRIGSRIEFTMDMPSAAMGWVKDGSIHCTGRVVRHHRSGEETMIAVVIDEYSLKA